MRLITAGKELGGNESPVLHCRAVMVKEDYKLKCPECGRVERRKLSSEYGTGIVLIIKYDLYVCKSMELKINRQDRR